MKKYAEKTLTFALAFSLGLLAGIWLDGARAEAGILDKLNFGVVDDLKTVGHSLRQMDNDIKSLQKQMDTVRASRMNIAKRLGVAGAVEEADRKEAAPPPAK